MPGSNHRHSLSRVKIEEKMTTPKDAPNEDEIHHFRPEPSEKRLEEERATLEKFPYGFERLGHMYSLGLPVKFEELQNRHPFDFLQETRDRFRLYPDPVARPAEPEDPTLFDFRDWLEPIIRKGQVYWDYCRDKWTEKESQLGSTLAPVSCIYSLWSIADICVQHGPLAFMVVYLLLTITFIIPLIYVELIIGQFHRTSVFKAIKQTCPLFQGLGYILLIACLFDYALSITRITWLFYSLITSIRHDFPWRDCSNPSWNTRFCKVIPHHDDTNTTYSPSSRTPAVEWYRFHVVRPWNHWTIPCGDDCTAAQVIPGIFPNLKILLCFLLVLCIYFFIIRLWCKPLGTVMLAIFYIGFALCGFTLLAFHSAFPRDNLVNDTVKEYFLQTPKGSLVKGIVNFDTWKAAFRHAIIGSGVGTGIYVTFGSHFTFPRDNIKTASILSGLASFTVHGLVIGCFLFCHVTLQTTMSLPNPTKMMYGYDSLFEMLPQVVAQHHSQGTGYMILLLMGGGVILLATVRVLCGLHVLRQYFVDNNKEYYEPYRVDYNYWQHRRIYRQDRYASIKLTGKRRDKLLLKIMGCIGIFQILFLFAGGSLLLFLLEHFWYGYAPVGVVFIEAFTLIFVTGTRTISDYVRRMTTWQVTVLFRFLLKNMVILFPTLMILHPVTLEEVFIPHRNLPHWFKYISILFVAFPYLFVLYWIIYSWKISSGLPVCRRLSLEVSPEHDHHGIVKGYKPPIRFHWMHYLLVPGGFRRGRCLPAYESPPGWQYPNCRKAWNMLCSFFWYGLGLCWLNNTWGCCSLGEARQTLFYMFPPRSLRLKPPIADKEVVYIPNRSIRRAKKVQEDGEEVAKERDKWFFHRMSVNKDGTVDPTRLDERDLEIGLVQQVGVIKMKEEEGDNFFDVFDIDTEKEEPLDTSSDSHESWDYEGKSKRLKLSSSDITSESFDTDSSVFRFSGDRKASEKDDGFVVTQLQDDVDDELPLYDFREEDYVPYDDDTDSWDLEDLENVENARSGVKMSGGHSGGETTEKETDSEEIEYDEEDENEEDVSDNDESGSDNDEEKPLISDDDDDDEDDDDDDEDDDDDDPDEGNSWSDSSGESSYSGSGKFRPPQKTNKLKALMRTRPKSGIKSKKKGLGMRTNQSDARGKKVVPGHHKKKRHPVPTGKK